MPRDLFGTVTDPPATLGSRKWYSVPLSFCIHTVVITVLVVVPLMASGALPALNDASVFVLVAPPELPKPPVMTPRRPTEPPTPRPDAAPIEAPSTIAPELEWELPEAAEVGALAGFGVVDGRIEGVVPPPPPPRPAVETPSKPVRPGGAIEPPARLTRVDPVYPPLALTARVQGLVIIEATIDTQGRVQDARVLRTDSPLLNEAAIAAVRQWTYTPTLLNGVPVSVLMTVTVQFRLR